MGRWLSDGCSHGNSVTPAVVPRTVERARTAWRRLTAAGIGDGRPLVGSSSLLPARADQGNAEKVVICWNMILEAAVESLGGTELAYTRERADGLIQARVHFRIPLDKDGAVFEDVQAVGMRCSEAWEAESTAAIAAFGQLQCEPFHIRVLDVSRMQYEELQKICNQYLLKTGEVRRGIKLLLSDWEDTMVKMEDCYKGLYEEVVENTCRGVNAAYSEIAGDVASCVYGLTRASYLNLVKLAGEAEEIKEVEWDVRSRAEQHFHGRCHNRPKTEQEYLPREMKLCMKRILDEMIKSLQWDEPTYRFKQLGADMYGCEALLVTKCNDARGESKKTVIAGGKGLSEDQALESACQNAVFLLEREMSICLADINYSRRSHAESYVSETREVLNLAVTISTKITSGWESLIDGLQACEKQCWDMVAQHPEKEPWNQLYNAKCDYAGALADLHGTCLSDLVLAKERHSLLSTWLDQETQGW